MSNNEGKVMQFTICNSEQAATNSLTKTSMECLQKLKNIEQTLRKKLPKFVLEPWEGQSGETGHVLKSTIMMNDMPKPGYHLKPQLPHVDFRVRWWQRIICVLYWYHCIVILIS